jgi:hypothetical protein
MCTVTVSDTASGSATTPGGSVSFSSDSPGSFSGSGSCTLSAGSCQISYTPAAIGSGTHKITANYSGDTAHAVSSASINETVTTPALPPPTVSNARESHRRWREGTRLAQFSRKQGLPVGTTFSFILNEQASVSLAFSQPGPGRSVNGKCVAATRQNRHKRACTRHVPAGGLAFTGHPGLNKVVFQGRVTPSKKLTLGSYTLTITATRGGQSSSPQTLNFTIAK